MTKVITRYFESAEQARATKRELVYGQGLAGKIVHIFETADGLVETLTAESVPERTAKTYQDRLAKGGAVMMVFAGYKPLGVAKTTRTVTADMGAVLLNGFDEEVDVKDPVPQPVVSVLTDHPLMLSRERDPESDHTRMADWPIPLINRRKPYTASVIPKHGRMANFPIPLTIRRDPYTGSIIERHGRMANFPIPLISRRLPFTGSIFERHARMANFPIPLISRRKPFTGTVIGRHTRMATVPFPLLINGKTGTNALIPGGPRMANFPIPLISKREPSNKSIFPRHARMANFPLPLVSKRKPFTGSIFPKHARMADMILPLIIRRSNDEPKYGSKVFSLSRLLGLPTLIKR